MKFVYCTIGGVLIAQIWFACQPGVDLKEQSREQFSLGMDTMSFALQKGQRFDSVNALRMAAADELFSNSLALDSTFMEVYYWRSVAKTKLNEYQNAREILSLGIAIGEQNHLDTKMLRMSRGILHYKLGDHEQAHHDFEKALSMYEMFMSDVGSNDGERVGAVSNMVLLHSYLGNHEAARQLIECHKSEDPFYSELESQIDSIDLNKVIERL